MEDLISLLAFLFFFFVLPVLQKRKAEARRQNEQPDEFEVLSEPPPRSTSREPGSPPRRRAEPEPARRPEPQPETPFQEALRQIREALKEAQQEHEAPRPEPAAPRPARPPKRVPDPHPSSLPAPPPIRFDRPEGFEQESRFEREKPAHERHGFGRENPLSEETFERRPAFAAESGARRPRSFDPHHLRREAPAARERATLLDRLRRPSTARDALIMAEVLGPPKGKLRR